MTGRCEFGGADISSLAVSAVFTGLLLAVEFYCVFFRKTKLVATIGLVFVTGFAIVATAKTMDALSTGQFLHAIDVVLLLATLFLGVTHLWWPLSLCHTTASATDSSPAAE